jgi:hypothetical protein
MCTLEDNINTFVGDLLGHFKPATFTIRRERIGHDGYCSDADNMRGATYSTSQLEVNYEGDIQYLLDENPEAFARVTMRCGGPCTPYTIDKDDHLYRVLAVLYNNDPEDFVVADR